VCSAKPATERQCWVLSTEASVVLLGGGDPKVPVGSPVSFTSALIQRGGSCPPLPLVELIQKVKTKLCPNVALLREGLGSGAS